MFSVYDDNHYVYHKDAADVLLTYIYMIYVLCIYYTEIHSCTISYLCLLVLKDHDKSCVELTLETDVFL